MIIWAVKNVHQGIHGYFSTHDKADAYIRSKLSTEYGSCWGWDCWKIKRIDVDKN